MRVFDEDGSAVAAITAACLLAVGGLFVGMLVGTVSIALIGQVIPLPEGSPEWTAVAMSAQGVGLVAMGLLYMKSRDLPRSYVRLSWPSIRDAGWVVAATLALFAVLAVVQMVITQLGLSPTEHSIAQSAEDNPRLLLPLIPLSVLVTGPAEELLFRGLIQTRLKEAFDTAVAVLVTSLIFSLIHIPAYFGTGFGAALATTLGVVFILGVTLGTIYEYSGNLVVPIVAHGVYNAVVFGSIYLEAVGGL